MSHNMTNHSSHDEFHDIFWSWLLMSGWLWQLMKWSFIQTLFISVKVVVNALWCLRREFRMIVKEQEVFWEESNIITWDHSKWSDLCCYIRSLLMIYSCMLWSAGAGKKMSRNGNRIMVYVSCGCSWRVLTISTECIVRMVWGWSFEVKSIDPCCMMIRGVLLFLKVLWEYDLSSCNLHRLMRIRTPLPLLLPKVWLESHKSWRRDLELNHHDDDHQRPRSAFLIPYSILASILFSCSFRIPGCMEYMYASFSPTDFPLICESSLCLLEFFFSSHSSSPLSLLSLLLELTESKELQELPMVHWDLNRTRAARVSRATSHSEEAGYNL